MPGVIFLEHFNCKHLFLCAGFLLTHWILDIFSAAVSHGLSILGTNRKIGGHILKLRFLI